MRTAQRFAYEALDASTDQIRVLAILPCLHHSARIRCELHHVDLDDLDEAPFDFYEALSYTWGESEASESIKLNGRTFYIRPNLGDAIRRLRVRGVGPSYRRFLWVDAICINQEDLAERRSQVLKMRRIYESAEQVIGWLGEAADDSDMAMDLIDTMTDYDSPDDFVTNGITSQKAENIHLWLSLAALFARPYWRRVWIRQELAVAQEIMMMCGSRKQKWPTLVLACELLDEVSDNFDDLVKKISTFSSGWHQVIFIDTFRERVVDAGSVPPEELLFHNRACEASDARDRVYAALSMMPDDFGALLTPDYTADQLTVFRKTALAMIDHDRRLNVLAACDQPLHLNIFPSWAPDLERDWAAQYFRPREGGDDLYSADGGKSLQYSLSTSELELRLKGVLVDAVSQTGPTWDGAAASTNPAVKAWRKIAIADMRQGGAALSPYDCFDAFWRTLIADQDLLGDRVNFVSNFVQSIHLHTQEGGDAFPHLDMLEWERLGDGTSGFAARFQEVMEGRRLFSTQEGRIGIGSGEMLPGDVICVLYGAPMPFALRRHKDGYRIVSELCEQPCLYSKVCD
jgi:hypothetical protein